MKQIKEIINERQYTVIKMPVTQSLMMVSRLSKLLGKDFSDSGDILGSLISAMSNDEVVGVIKDLVGQVIHNSKQINFDAHFQDHPEDLLPVVGLSLRENVLPFFAPKALETLMQMITKDLVPESQD